MPVRSCLVVLLRLFLILQAFNVILVAIGMIGSNGVSAPAELIEVGFVCLFLVPILSIYRAAGRVVDMLAPASSTDPSERAAVASVDSLQAIAFSAVGAYILHGAVRETIATLSYINSGTLLHLQTLVGLGLSWLFGGFLLLGAPGLRGLISALRRADTKRFEGD